MIGYERSREHYVLPLCQSVVGLTNSVSETDRPTCVYLRRGRAATVDREK